MGADGTLADGGLGADGHGVADGGLGADGHGVADGGVGAALGALSPNPSEVAFARAIFSQMVCARPHPQVPQMQCVCAPDCSV